MEEIARSVARALLQIGGVKIDKENLLVFKSGITSPIYIDNRRFPFYPEVWKIVIDSFIKTIERERINFDAVGGIEAAGIPHSATLGYALGKPSVFIRKNVKDHGTKKMVEGGDVSGKTVLIIEDLVTTGGSGLRGVEALRSEGATVNACLVITSYGLEEAVSAFEDARVKLHSLTSLPVLLEEGLKMKKFSDDQVATVLAWAKNLHIQ